MAAIDANLRKAAILLRSLDSETAAVMLAQLSPGEAAPLRAAIRALGTVEYDEQAEVVAEFRRTRPPVHKSEERGVELKLSTTGSYSVPDTDVLLSGISGANQGKRFEFLASASTNALVPFLAREHAQTIAVVLAHLEPARAAAILGALPEKLQADTIERLSALGETDPDSITALEREMAAWLSTRSEDRGGIARRREAVANILAATDPKTRRGILSRLEQSNRPLAEQLEPRPTSSREPENSSARAERRYESQQASETSERIRARLASLERQIATPLPAIQRAEPLPHIEFDQLVHLDAASLSGLVRGVDPNVLAIALSGSDEALINRICQQMPKKTARAFRCDLRRIGPTRLSDVEAAQRTVAGAASRLLARGRGHSASRT